MTVQPVALLAFNGAAQILVSLLLGLFMLALLQPWGRPLAAYAPKWRDLLSAHLDWIMLAVTQFAAAFAIERYSIPHSCIIAWVLVYGGWLNPVPYLLRGVGIDAFVFGGPWKQRAGACLGLSSVLALLVGWGLVAKGLWTAF